MMHPYIFSDNNCHNICFYNVQQQNNIKDSGILDITLATSVLLGTRPNRINHNINALRLHLVKTSKSILLFIFPLFSKQLHHICSEDTHTTQTFYSG